MWAQVIVAGAYLSLQHRSRCQAALRQHRTRLLVAAAPAIDLVLQSNSGGIGHITYTPIQWCCHQPPYAALATELPAAKRDCHKINFRGDLTRAQEQLGIRSPGSSTGKSLVGCGAMACERGQKRRAQDTLLPLAAPHGKRPYPCSTCTCACTVFTHCLG